MTLKRALVVLALVLGSVVTRAAEAKMMVHYDLAGLLLQADAVVIADRVGTVKTPAGELTRYRVVKALRGTRKPGDVVEVYDQHFNTDGHKLDGKAVLFLTTYDGKPSLVASGLRVLEGGKVWRFEQRNNPGPFDLVPQGTDPQDQWGLGGAQLELAGLEAAIVSAQQRIDAVAGAKAIKDPARRRAAILAVFPPGPGTSSFYVDLLADRARTLLVEAGDLDGALLVELRDRGRTFGAFAKPPELITVALDPKRGVALRVAALAVLRRGFELSDSIPQLDRLATLLDDPDPIIRAAAIATAAQPAQVITSDRAQQRALDAWVAKLRTAIAKRYASEADPRVLAAVLEAFEGSFRRPAPARATGPRIVAVPSLVDAYVAVDVYCVRPAKITDAQVILLAGTTRVPAGAFNARVHCVNSSGTGGGPGGPPAGSYAMSLELTVQGSGKVTLPLGRLIVGANGERRLED